MSHTPGPWRTDETPNGTWMVCATEGDNEPYGSVLDGAVWTAPDAALIAAAPDLLAALEATRSVLFAPLLEKDHLDDAILNAKSQADAAIAKARCDEPRSKHPKEPE